MSSNLQLVMDPTTGQLLFLPITGGGSGTPGGVDTNIQFNDSGAFGGSDRFTWDGSTVAVNAGANTGIELVSNPDFTGSATDWTLSGGWAYTTNSVAHTPGVAGEVTQDIAVIPGAVYRLTIVMSGRTTGVVEAFIGSQAVPFDNGVLVNGTNTLIITAGFGFNVTLSCDDVFDGTIESVHVVETLPAQVWKYDNSEVYLGALANGQFGVFSSADDSLLGAFGFLYTDRSAVWQSEYVGGDLSWSVLNRAQSGISNAFLSAATFDGSTGSAGLLLSTGNHGSNTAVASIVLAGDSGDTMPTTVATFPGTVVFDALNGTTAFESSGAFYFNGISAVDGATFQLQSFLDAQVGSVGFALDVHHDEANSAEFSLYVDGNSGNNTPDTTFTFPGAALFIGASGYSFDNTITFASDQLPATTVTFTDGAAANVGTLTNSPATGNPTKWIAIDDNGTTRYIPAW